MASSEDSFEKKALAKRLSTQAIEHLTQHNLDSEEAIAGITDEDLDGIQIPAVQKGKLMMWARELTSGGHSHSQTLPRQQRPDTPKRDEISQPKRHSMEDVNPNVVTDGTQPDFKVCNVNIAVCGRTGTGKSSLINCILNLQPKDEGAAKTGLVESTVTIKSYKHPSLPGVVIWDLPGVGTDKFPKESYIKTVQFNMYDALIIVCSERVCQDDTWLATEAQKHGKPFYFARSKIDQELINFRRDYGEDADEKDLLDKIRQNVQELLKQNGMVITEIYLVCSIIPYQLKWDFPRLMEKLVDHSSARNATAMLMAVVICSENIISRKNIEFSKRIDTVAARAANPAQNCKAVILEEIKSYYDHFGISDGDLKAWELEVEKMEPRLKEIKSNLMKIIKLADGVKDVRFLYILANSVLFKHFQWAKRVVQRRKDIEATLDAAHCLAEERSALLIRETTHELLNSALDFCTELALGILQQRSLRSLHY